MAVPAPPPPPAGGNSGCATVTDCSLAILVTISDELTMTEMKIELFGVYVVVQFLLWNNLFLNWDKIV